MDRVGGWVGFLTRGQRAWLHYIYLFVHLVGPTEGQLQCHTQRLVRDSGEGVCVWLLHDWCKLAHYTSSPHATNACSKHSYGRM